MYDFSQWIDGITLTLPPNSRQLNEEILKIFIKQVFIKSELHGYDFKFFEAPDLDLYKITHFPNFIKKEAQERKMLLVETPALWFLIAPSDHTDANPFSLHRFLYEETVGGAAFLNSLAIPKHLIDDPVAQRFFLDRIGRIFSLDKNIDIEIKKFVLMLKRIIHEQLEPILLDQNFRFDGSDTERMIAKRAVKFEEALASNVLQKLPMMIRFSKDSEPDREFLLQGLGGFFENIIQLITRFQMHPLARHSFVARNLKIKILAIKTLVQKKQTLAV